MTPKCSSAGSQASPAAVRLPPRSVQSGPSTKLAWHPRDPSEKRFGCPRGHSGEWGSSVSQSSHLVPSGTGDTRSTVPTDPKQKRGQRPDSWGRQVPRRKDHSHRCLSQWPHRDVTPTPPCSQGRASHGKRVTWGGTGHPGHQKGRPSPGTSVMR